ncbi:hypothetical protein HanRHA438_Chr03g0120641 [Helianthus annuus]|nr:hypothetical protein HanRHA438_Chr03g0120641 [Helianthus annuus]
MLHIGLRHLVIHLTGHAPCPYPTRPWASPVDNRPNSRPSNGQGSSRQQSAQAHIIETDPLEPTQLAAAVNALSMDSGGDQWHFDSGFQGWHGPESSNSSSELYPLTPPASANACFASTKDSPFWHDRLGHPGRPLWSFLILSILFLVLK